MITSTKINALIGTLALAGMLVFGSQVASAAPTKQGIAATSADYSPDTGSSATSVDTEATNNSVDTEDSDPSKDIDAADTSVDTSAADIGSETEAADISSETPDVGDVAGEVANSTPDN